MTRPETPLPIRILSRLLSGAYRHDVVDDLREAFEERRRRSRTGASVWLWAQLLSPATLRLLHLLRARERRVGGSRGPVGWTRPLRHAGRGVMRRPGFSLTVVITLALGIGANTAIFSVVDGVLFEPLPYPDGDRLVYVWGTTEGDPTELLSGPQAAEVAALEIFREHALIFGGSSTSMVRGALPEPTRTLTVSHTFFDLFGIDPRLGRTFRPADEFKLTNEQIRDPAWVWPVGAMVLSHGFWQRAFGGDPAVLGRTVTVGGRVKEVVGVMPPGFRAVLPSELGETTPADVWVLSAFDQPSFPRDTRFVRVVGRLRDGADLVDAQSSLDALSAWQRETFPEDARDGFGMRATLLRDEAGSTARGPLLVLLAAVGFVLLIACGNVATLFMVRGAERSAEIRLRRALGASRRELVGLGLSESLLLSALGGGLGIAIAGPLTRVLVRLAPSELPRADAIGIDGSVLMFTAGLTLGVALLAGLLPALRSSDASLTGSGLGDRTTAGRRHRGFGRVAVASEVALAVVLVIGTGLMVRSLSNIVGVDPGFDARGVYTWEANLTTPSHPTWDSRVRYLKGVQAALLAEPGVTAVGAMSPVPFDGADRTGFRIGMGEDAPEIVADFRRTSPGALEALGLEPIVGRLLEWRDLEDFDRLHAVVDTRFAEAAWPGQSAVGRIIGVERREYGDGSRVWDEWKRVEVVGVVPPIRGRDLRTEDPPSVYVSYSQNMWGNAVLMARSARPLDPPTLRAASGSVDRRPLVYHHASLEAIAEERVAPLRFALTLIGAFATLGMVLAATGVYGLLSFTVRQRERELHIRAALGARGRELGSMVLVSGLGLTAAGVGAGWAAAWGLTRFIDSLLFDVAPTDPATFLAVAGFLLLVAALACWIPSRRARRTDPAAALR